MFEAPMFARVVPPNLTRAVAKYSDSELEAIIRQGIKPDGRGLMIMPSSNYSAFRDQDLRNIIARFFFVKGEFTLEPEQEMSPVTPERPGDENMVDGEYLARIISTSRGDREVGLMSEMALEHFTYLHDEEIGD